MNSMHVQRAQRDSRLRLVGLTCLLVLLAPVSLSANPRDAVVESLSNIDTTWPAAGLETWMNDDRGRADDVHANRVQLGGPMRIRVAGATGAELLVVSVDAHGVIQLIVADESSGVGSTRTILEAIAAPPLGATDVFVFATPEALALRGFQPTRRTPLIIDADDADRFVVELTRALGAEPRVASAQVRAWVYGRGSKTRSIGGDVGSTQYTVEDVIDYFTSERTRAIGRPRLDVAIQFEFGSADLTPHARSNLDVVGRALRDFRLEDLDFDVVGHTDDVGDEAFNMRLSRRRAEAVRDYLMARHAVAAGRLTVDGRGEREPLMSGHSDEARRMNRRVEFALERE
jgi:outer membrane protein OmpA-like peptidoglycan-associated protein